MRWGKLDKCNRIKDMGYGVKDYIYGDRSTGQNSDQQNKSFINRSKVRSTDKNPYEQMKQD